MKKVLRIFGFFLLLMDSVNAWSARVGCIFIWDLLFFLFFVKNLTTAASSSYDWRNVFFYLFSLFCIYASFVMVAADPSVKNIGKKSILYIGIAKTATKFSRQISNLCLLLSLFLLLEESTYYLTSFSSSCSSGSNISWLL